MAKFQALKRVRGLGAKGEIEEAKSKLQRFNPAVGNQGPCSRQGCRDYNRTLQIISYTL